MRERSHSIKPFGFPWLREWLGLGKVEDDGLI